MVEGLDIFLSPMGRRACSPRLESERHRGGLDRTATVESEGGDVQRPTRSCTGEPADHGHALCSQAPRSSSRRKTPTRSWSHPRAWVEASHTVWHWQVVCAELRCRRAAYGAAIGARPFPPHTVSLARSHCAPACCVRRGYAYGIQCLIPYGCRCYRHGRKLTIRRHCLSWSGGGLSG